MTEAFEIPLTFSPALEGKPYRTGGKSGCLAVILLVTIIAFRLYAEEWPEAVAVRQVAKRITDTLHEQDGKK
jgi:hypothetical protein